MHHRTGITLFVLLVVLSLLGLGVPAGAVLIASGDGTGNTSAPADDPGFANVGTIGGLSAVYLGRGWVVTAAHVGVGDVTLGGRSFPADPESEVRLVHADGEQADLIAFRLAEDPGLPSLDVTQATPAPGAKLLMIGHGRNRGDVADYFGRPGWYWGAGKAMRWGTNVVSGVGADVDTAGRRTRCFYTDFSLPGEEHEAQAASGDSGGAVFAATAGGWKLAGVIIAIHAPFQPTQTALDGNLTYVADLASYRAQLVGAGVLEPAGTPELEVGAEYLVMGLLRVGSERQVRIPLANRGDAPLHIRAVSLAPGSSQDYQVETEPLPLILTPPEHDPAGAYTYVVVRLAPGSTGWHVGRLVIESDDPARPRVEIDLFGYAYGGFRGRF